MKTFLAALSWSLLLLLAPTLRAEAPNIVFIVCDDQAWTDFGFMGSREVHTPNMDRLASESAVFPHGYVPTSLCMPSLATMITGRYPHEHQSGVGLFPLRTPPQVVQARYERDPPLPALLASQGYLSMQTGKWWEGDYRISGFTHGMTVARPVEGSTFLERPDAAGKKVEGRLDRGMSLLAGAEGLRIGREGLGPIDEFLAARKDQPFFLWYAPEMPHTPHDPPQRLYDKYKTADRKKGPALYMAMCEWFDETIGELRELLEKRGVSDNTLTVFVVDNGYVPVPGDISWFDKKSKASPHDAGIRTPLLLHWPGKITPATYDVPVETIDLVPTVLAAVGAPPRPELPGVNLLEVCDGKPLERDALFGANFREKAKDPQSPADTVDFRWCIAWPWKLILPKAADKSPELYNLADDPHEKSNLAAEHPDRVASLTAKLDAWWKLPQQ